MPKRRRLTDDEIRKLPRKTRRYTLADPELIGHYLRVPARTSKAAITFVAVSRDPEGKQKWTTLGTNKTIGLVRARELARDAIGRVRSGKPPTSPGGPTVADVAEEWLERRVRRGGFRTVRERERIVERYVAPCLGSRGIADVRRADITSMLDRIEDENGAPMADAVLRVFSAIARWHHQRDENYRPPLTAGMRRVSERRRKRILTDDEIRSIWNCDGGSYGAFVKLALLTAQRRDKLRTLLKDDVKDGVWVIRTAPREKGNPGRLQLPKLAIEIIGAQPKFVGNPYLFPGRGKGPMASSGYHKAEFDKLSGIAGWRVHNLRRTARSLMSRAGVQTEISERILGHTQGDLIEIYDQYDYGTEMAAALEKLAALIKQITSS
jgi:integrase